MKRGSGKCTFISFWLLFIFYRTAVITAGGSVYIIHQFPCGLLILRFYELLLLFTGIPEICFTGLYVVCGCILRRTV